MRRTRDLPDHVGCRHCRRAYRRITASHLQRIHGYTDEHPVVEYKREFNLRYATSPASRKKLSQAKTRFWDERGQHWTRKLVISAIRRIHHAGVSLRCEDVPVRLYEAARRLLGSWEAAIQKARLDYEQVTGVRRWSRAKVLETIRTLSEQGVPLNADYVTRYYGYLHAAALDFFPSSWHKALRAAGLDPQEHTKPRGRWTRMKAEEWVRNRVARKWSILAHRVPRDLLGFVHKRLGEGWVEFVESLGYRYPGIKKRYDWTAHMVLAEIRRLKREGQPLNYHAIKLTYQALIQQARKYFASWDAARARAGISRSSAADRRRHRPRVMR